MNFLAHFYFATQFQTPVMPLPSYTAGTALPDLLSLASPRTRLRQRFVEQTSTNSPEEKALRGGVLSHLAADAAFHKTSGFAQAQAEAGRRLDDAGFTQMRVRRFFVAHILVELALDAALLRANAAIAQDFYAAFTAADKIAVTRWAETTAGRPLPELPNVLARFAESRYLLHYAIDAGVAEGLSRLCRQARQDTFEGANFTRLTNVIGETVQSLGSQIEYLLSETASPTTAK